MKRMRSLENVGAGEEVTVRRILFDTLRSHCRERGIEEGSHVSGRAADARQVIVETSGGQAVPCERRYARFIQVTSQGQG